MLSFESSPCDATADIKERTHFSLGGVGNSALIGDVQLVY